MRDDLASSLRVIEKNVEVSRRHAEHPQQQRRLTAMMDAVIHGDQTEQR